jgi:hypothetical protein
MAYDPVKALQAAGVFAGSMPESVKQALSGLSQEEVDLIISAHTARSETATLAPWMSPGAMPTQGAMTRLCACGIWSGSGSDVAKDVAQ